MSNTDESATDTPQDQFAPLDRLTWRLWKLTFVLVIAVVLLTTASKLGVL